MKRALLNWLCALAFLIAMPAPASVDASAPDAGVTVAAADKDARTKKKRTKKKKKKKSKKGRKRANAKKKRSQTASDRSGAETPQDDGGEESESGSLPWILMLTAASFVGGGAWLFHRRQQAESKDLLGDLHFSEPPESMPPKVQAEDARNDPTGPRPT